MKKWLIATLLASAATVMVVRTAWAITEAQSYTCPAVEALGLEYVDTGKIGGPQQYRVTQKTINLLTKYAKEKRTIVIQNDGSLVVK